MFPFLQYPGKGDGEQITDFRELEIREEVTTKGQYKKSFRMYQDSNDRDKTMHLLKTQNCMSQGVDSSMC